MQSPAVVMRGPGVLSLEELALTAPEGDDLVVDVCWSGISTGTEKLFWTGRMPPFPGMGYPLVPGYEAAGEVVEAGAGTSLRPGDFVFVPGASCFDGAIGLFGGAAGRLVTRADRVVRVDRAAGAEGALLALAATARHVIAGIDKAMPELIVGHGVMGRLLARLVVAAGGPPPTVWENRAERREGACGYPVIAPEDDPRRDYAAICDASGDAGMLNSLIGRLRQGGEIVLAGFYPGEIAFAFAPAFMREVRLRIAAEWTKADLLAVAGLVESGALSLAGLVTHRAPASAAHEAYPTAFGDPNCLKMVLNWKDAA